MMKRLLLLGMLMINYSSAKIIVMRHGEGTHNVERFYSSNPDHPNYRPAYLTEKGKAQVKATAHQLQKHGFTSGNIQAVFVSPLPRTQQTAEILVQNNVISSGVIKLDKRLIEVQMGDREGRPYGDYSESHWDHSNALSYNGETIDQITKRMQNIFNEVKSMSDDTQHVLFITHGTPSLKLLEWHLKKYITLPTAGFYIID